MKNNLKKYMEVGVAAFLTFAASTLFFFAVLKFKDILAALGNVADILESIIIGVAIAYLLNPIMNFFEKKLLKYNAGEEDGTKKKNLIRSVSILFAMICGIAIVATVIGLMLPQLFDSIYGIIKDMPVLLSNLYAWVGEITRDYPEVGTYINDVLGSYTSQINEWLTTDLLVQIKEYGGYITSGFISALSTVMSVVSTVMNVVVGLIVAVYVLYSKETFAGQGKKIIYACLSPEKGNLVLETIRKSHQIFGGFIIGKIIDSAIIGVLCFICLSFMNMPYTLLLSVIIGVTNVIPFFGPFIGAVPAVLIVLMVDPLMALYMAIFVLILQQVDGNIIGPAILGESTGLSPFWVIFSIMLGGGLFGFFGMILGVPAFGVVYYLIKMALDHALRKKAYPTETEYYVNLKEVDEMTRVPVQYAEHEKGAGIKPLRIVQKLKNWKNINKTKQ